MIFSRIPRAIALSATSAALVIATAGAAYAASWDVTAPTTNGGYGRDWGALTYTSDSSFNYGGYVEDICPADGFGISYYFNFVRGNGNYANTGMIDWDTDGCDNDVFHRSDSISESYTIARSRTIMCETNNGDLCYLVLSFGLSNWKDNPYA